MTPTNEQIRQALEEDLREYLEDFVAQIQAGNEASWLHTFENIFDKLNQAAEEVPAGDWIKAEPAKDYEHLKTQFRALKNMINSMGVQLQHYQKKNYETGKKHLAELQASLDSERAMNAKLTQELEQSTKWYPESCWFDDDGTQPFVFVTAKGDIYCTVFTNPLSSDWPEVPDGVKGYWTRVDTKQINEIINLIKKVGGE